MKWSNSKVNKLSKEEMVALIDKAKGTKTVFYSASKDELKRELINCINKGLIKSAQTN